jgi:RHS repeat-associated protein
MLDSVGLVHMSGRVYDPYLGRFLSADTVIQSLGATESINPYAYAWNDPLKYVDPSGHSLLGDILGAIVGLAIIIFAPELGLPAITSSLGVETAMVAGFVGGFVGAYVSTGSLSAALTAGLISGLTAAAFAEIGSYASSLQNTASEWSKADFVLAHAAVGCASAAASGGNCGRGALSAAISEAAVQGNWIKPAALGTWGSFKGAAEAGVLGGMTSEITGGKFGDGFSVAAAGYLYNSAPHVGAAKPQALFVSTTGYATEDDAAEAAYSMAATYKDFKSIEYGGVIFKDDAGYEFSLFRGTASDVGITLHSGMVDWWHTHPSDPLAPYLDRENENLSAGPGQDLDQQRKIEAATGYAVGAYLLTPSQTLKFIPNPFDPRNSYGYTLPFGSKGH